MKIQMNEPKEFKAFKGYVNLLSVIVEEVTFLVSKEKISVLKMDPSHVCMVDASIKAGAFTSYAALEDEQISVNIKEFKRFLDRIDEKKEKVEIYNDVDKARLVIKLTRANATRKFEVPLLDPYDEEVPKPRIEFHTKVRMRCEALASAVKDVALVNEHVKFRSSKDPSLHVFGEGDMGSAFSDWEKDSDDIIEIDAKEESLATYTLSYLAPIVAQCKDVGDNVTLEFSKDMPIKIDAETGDHLLATFYLAPCINP